MQAMSEQNFILVQEGGTSDEGMPLSHRPQKQMIFKDKPPFSPFELALAQSVDSTQR